MSFTPSARFSKSTKTAMRLSSARGIADSFLSGQPKHVEHYRINQAAGDMTNVREVLMSAVLVRNRDDVGSGVRRGLAAVMTVFQDQHLVRIDVQPFGRLEVNLRMGLAVHDILGGQ